MRRDSAKRELIQQSPGVEIMIVLGLAAELIEQRGTEGQGRMILQHRSDAQARNRISRPIRWDS
jgi:hypothetical protein